MTTTFIAKTDKQLQKFKVTTDETGKVLTQSFTQTAKTGKELKSGLSSVFNANKLYLYWNLTKRLRTSLASVYNLAVDYIETQNKFNVSMGDGKPQAVKFVNQISEAIGIAKTELMDYQATYKNILSGLGNFTDVESEKISESLVKMALDYSSMFNVGQEDAMNKFQSALVGSIRPIRSDSGYDISDTTIGAKANALGISRSVNQLNQMEKRMLRIIVLMEQLGRTGAMGDLARTIEQPANQMKVFKAQIQEVGIWIGNVFMGTIGKVLPYINAFVMTIKELIKMLAIFTGYTSDDTNLSDIFEAVEDSTSGVSNNLGTASKKAKELRKVLMGFDVLNVINTPTESKSSGSSGVGTIDPKILGALSDYESKMEQVSMRATEIRDRIMEWLGYTKEIDPVTGEISWKLKEGYQNIEKILDLLKIIVGVTILKKGASLIKGIVTAITGSKIIFSIKAVAGGAATLGEGFAYAFPFITKVGTAIAGAGKAITGFVAGLSATTLAIAGAVAAATALAGVVIYLNVSPAVKQLDVFKGASEETKEKLGGLVDEFNSLQKELKKQDWGDKIITEADIAKTKASLDKITGAVKEGLEKAKNESVSGFNDTLKQSMGEELFTEMYNKTVSFYDNQATLIDEKQKQILDIQTKASKEKRSLTEEEASTISRLYNEMQTVTVEILSASEEEAKLILGRMSQNAKALSAEQASAIIKESIKTRDETIKNAQDTYTKQVEQARKLRDAGQITEEEYQKWIEASANARDERIKDAEEMHRKVYGEFKAENEEIAKYIDEDTGEIKSKWSYFWGEVGKAISNWWTNDVAPWFTKEKWQELGQKAQEGLKQKYDELVQKFKPISDWWSKNVAPWFTKEKWQQLGKDAIQGVKDTLKLDQINLKMPHISWSSNGAQASGALKKALELLGLPTQMPKLSVSWYAQGGLPDVGELFVAREAGPELVGRMGNSNAVMNNQQIVQAVSQGVAQAVASVMKNIGNGETRLIVDGREIASIVEERILRNQNIYGTV